MTITATRLNRLSVTFVFILSILVAHFAHVQFAGAATIYDNDWDGSAGDGLFSTAANWSANAVPDANNIIVFSVSSLGSQTTLDNDISSLSVAGIKFTGTNVSGFGYTLTGNTITIADLAPVIESIDNSATNSGGSPAQININTGITLAVNVDVIGVINFGGSGKTFDTQTYAATINAGSNTCVTSLPQFAGSGSLSFSGTNVAYSLSADNSAYTGAISISSASLYVSHVSGLGASSGGTTITGSGTVSLYATSNSAWAEPFTLSGTGNISAQHESSNGCSGAGQTEVYTATLTGAVVLNGDFKYNGSDNMTITGTYTTNGHSFTVSDGAIGILTTPSGAVVSPTITTNLSGDSPTTDVTIVNKETATLNGTRQAISVGSGGILKGTGSAQSVYTSLGSTIAPGNSPGKLTILDTFTLGGAYEAEVLNKDTYDQLEVGATYSGGGSAVTFSTGSTLSLVLYDGWAVNQGETFTIINNLHSSAVSGTFDGLAEGAQLTVDGITFSISYVGGTGNDVVLTALNTGTDPTPPNTGAELLKLASPVALVGLGIVSAVLLFILARRRSTK
jgi:hypothetical protein